MPVEEIKDRCKNDLSFHYGRWLSSPPAGEEVVISGMSGRLPESNTVHEFRDHLFNKRDMVSGDDRRWKLDHPEIPQRTAKIRNIDKFDAGYFGVHYRQADVMDPIMRTFMETVIEAVMDAGLNPLELQGTKTGVFTSLCYADMENETLMNITEEQRFAVTGFCRSFVPHRISYYLKLKGPACVIDTACSSSLNALDTAFKSIRNGQCDNAIVGCGNLLLHPGLTIQFFRLGLLSGEGVCKVFDQSADGYVRGEAVACVFLQKAKNSQRIYAQIIATKVNSDGFKEQGITFPSTQAQIQLMTEIYEDACIEASELAFLEVHGTGTQVGDPQEVEAIDCALAKKRERVLLVGSVKSSIGHTEPASGICSIIKVLIAMETGWIVPNINLKKIKDGMKGFEEGRMAVVTELTELEGDDAIVGINNFGFGGNNVHVILRRFKKSKIDGGLPKDDIPRLVCVSGRTEEAVLELLAKINRIDKILLSKKFKTFREILQDQTDDILGSVCLQVCVVEILKLLKLQPTAVFGDSYGECLTKYYYDVISMDETISAALKNDLVENNSKLQFQAVCNKWTKLETKGERCTDFTTYEDLLDVHKNVIILNVSDEHLNCKDVLLVEGPVIHFLNILGR